MSHGFPAACQNESVDVQEVCMCIYIYIYIKSNQVIYQWIMLPIAMLDRQRISTVSYGHHDQSPCRRDTPFTEHQLIGAVNPQ